MFLPSNPYSRQATVEEAIYPRRVGRIRFQGSSWPARCELDQALEPGTIVSVLGNQNITLIVEPMVDE